jgi:hypothetical protein
MKSELAGDHRIQHAVGEASNEDVLVIERVWGIGSGEVKKTELKKRNGVRVSFVFLFLFPLSPVLMSCVLMKSSMQTDPI